MDIFLRARHWQLFLVLIVLPFFIGLATVVNMLAHVIQYDQPDPAIIFSHLKFLPVAVIWYAVGKMCWEWAVAIRLQRLAPQGVPFKNTAFKIFFVFTLVYYPVFFFCLFSFLGQVTALGNVPDPAAFIWFAAIFPLSMFNTFCMFYCYYYTAKTLKTIELQRPASFSDFVLEFVLIWFFFVGVWILQPKINDMALQEANPADTL